MLNRLRFRTVGAMGAALICLLFTLVAAPAGGQQEPPPEEAAGEPIAQEAIVGVDAVAPTYLVTLAARECPSYTDIRANRARNNIMESLQDLGPDTNYVAGEPINPTKEDAAPQSNCTPITNWRFQLGNGINGKTPGTNLSRVASPGTVATTQASVPQRDAAGNPTGSNIAGAVTIELTAAEANLASRRSLWVQGGIATDPLLTGTFGNQYAFGALRCALDNLNGDNVEYVSYPSNAVHVFCYAYYVDTVPQPATVIIRKTVSPESLRGIKVNFGGNLSFNPGGAFSLTPSVSTGEDQVSFVRAANVPWQVVEDVPPGWVVNITCTGGGASTWSPTPPGTLDFTLAPGATMTCTFANDWQPPAGNGVQMFKTTVGNTGTFPIDAYDTGTLTPSLFPWVATTTVEDDTTQASGGEWFPITGATYDFVETLPAPDGVGAWTVGTVYCVPTGSNAVAYTPTEVATGRWKVSVPINSAGTGPGTDCGWLNTYKLLPASLSIRARTVGQPGGESSYYATPAVSADDPSTNKYRNVDNPTADTFVNSTPDPEGDNDLSAVPPEQWYVFGTPPDASDTVAWRLEGIACTGSSTTPTYDLALAQAVVTLPPGGAVQCDYSWVPQAVVTITTTKVIQGTGARNANAQVSLVCDNGNEDILDVGPSVSGTATSATPGTTFTDTECEVTETATGAAPGTTVATAYEVRRTLGSTTTVVASGSGPLTFAIDAIDDAGATFDAVVTNTYTSAATTTTAVSPSSTAAPTTAPSGAGNNSGQTGGDDLAVTGPALPMWLVVLRALAVTGLGLALVAFARDLRKPIVVARPPSG